jgi:hypothetical protein
MGIEQLKGINPGAVDCRNVPGGSFSNYSRQEILAALPNTPAGQLHGFIAQAVQPDNRLRQTILRSCRKHYLFVKYKRKWSRKAKDLYDKEIDQLTDLVIFSICRNKDIPVRLIAEQRNEPRSTFHDNYYDVYLEIKDHVNDKLGIAFRDFIKKKG